MARRCFCPTASWLPFSPTSEETEKPPLLRDRGPDNGRFTSAAGTSPGPAAEDERLWTRRGGDLRGGRFSGNTGSRGAQAATAPSSRAPGASAGAAGTCIEPELQLADELLRAGRAGRRQHLLVAAALQAVGDVVPHRAGEQHGLLPDQDHLGGGDRSRGLAETAAAGTRPSFSPWVPAPRPSPALCPPRPSSPPDGVGSGAHTRRPAPRPAAPGPRWAGTDSAAARPPCSSQTRWAPPAPSSAQDSG